MTKGVQLSQAAKAEWFAVQVQPRRERLALEHLTRQDFEAYCPLRKCSRRIGQRRIETTAPFFPGYLFVRLDLERQRWRSINGTIGVLRLVSFGAGNRPAPLPAGFVTELQRTVGRDGFVSLGDGLKAGDEVRITAGPFADLCGILENASDGERVTLLLRLLSQETRVHLTRDLLEAA